MDCLAGALFALMCVAMYEAFSNSTFLSLLADIVYWGLYVLLSPLSFVWHEVRLVFKGISQEQYSAFVLCSGVETCRLIGRIYYAHDPAASKVCTRHFFLRVRKTA